MKEGFIVVQGERPMAHIRYDGGYLVSKGYTHYIFVLLFLLYMFDWLDRMVVVSLFPFIKADWGLTDTQCGMLISAVSWSIVVLTFPVSVFIDRWSRKKSIGLMALLWSLATAACAFTRNYVQLFAARTVIGVGEAGYAPGGTAMISALFPEKKRAKIMGLWNASIPLGSAIGIAVGGLIAEQLGWRHALGLVALPGMVVAVLMFRVRDYKSVELIRTTKDPTGMGEQKRMKSEDMVREFTRTPSLLFTYLGFAGSMFANTALLTWLPTYFHRMDQIPMSRAGVKGGLVMLLAIVGAPLGGYLADKWLQRRINGRLLFVALSSATSCVLMFAAFALFSGLSQYACLLLGGVSAAAFVPGAAAVTQDVVHPGLRAISYSFCVIIQHILGSALGPIFVGNISDRYGIDVAMTILPFAYLVAAGMFFSGSFFYNHDLEKAEKAVLEIE
ncbi:MAG: MFS transporter [Deltaproteobacteria bacterium]|nr:MFS transporter [Deltaproteobacteria bacterium]MCF8118607.1 MFS transporter [Deltaproteobacteria bacterium]